MLSRKIRLKRSVFSQKPVARRASPLLQIAFFGGERGAAVVVSKKVAIRATDRNKIRRRVRHALKGQNWSESVVVYPTKGIREATFPQIVAALAELLNSRYTK